MKETWSIAPLEGKYYGTEVMSSGGKIIKVWVGGSEPSLREIKKGWEPGDGMDHVESIEDYSIAHTIVNALNNYKTKQDFKVNQGDIKDLLQQIDAFLAKAYSAYVHAEGLMMLTQKPRITLEEVTELQSRIRLIKDSIKE